MEPHSELITHALHTEGGHLSIGRNGFSLYYGRGAALSGHDSGPIKAACIARGVPVIDKRRIPIDVVARLALSTPAVAVDENPDPAPWCLVDKAPLNNVARIYRNAGAEVLNITFEDRPVPPVILIGLRLPPGYDALRYPARIVLMVRNVEVCRLPHDTAPLELEAIAQRHATTGSTIENTQQQEV